MEIEDYFCTYEQSKKLIELGVKKRGCFTWYIHEGEYDILPTRKMLGEDVPAIRCKTFSR